MEVQDYILIKINGAYEYLTRMDIEMFLEAKSNILYSKYSKTKELVLDEQEQKAVTQELSNFIKNNNHYNNKCIETIIDIRTK